LVGIVVGTVVVELGSIADDVGNMVRSKTGLFVGASTVSIAKPTGASEAGRLDGDLLGRSVGISVGLKTGLVVGLSTKLIPGGKVGSEVPKTGLIVGTPVIFVEVRVCIVLRENRARRTVVTPTHAVVAIAAIVTAAIIILVVTANVVAVAEAAIESAPAATDDPADAAA
jgi:hypothetical protein